MPSNKPCFDLRGRRSRVSWWLQAALGNPLRAQGRRLGIPSGSPAGGGGPGARESAARGRDLSEENPAPHSAAAPPCFVW